jgi:hypothetical protein
VLDVVSVQNFELQLLKPFIASCTQQRLWISISGKSRRRYFTCDETREMDRRKIGHVARDNVQTDGQAVAVDSDRRDCGGSLPTDAIEDHAI